MATATRHPLITAEQLLERPDDDYKYELDRGALVRMSPTGAEHGVVTVKLGHALQDHVQTTGAGVCCGAETGFILQRDPDLVRAPDAAFVAASRIPESGVPASYWPFAPDFAAEVASPSDRFSQLSAKVVEYFQAGTRLVWIVEPATRTVHEYWNPNQVQVVGEAEELTGDGVLPGFRCPVHRLFP